ncbi:MAG: Xaa-Pro aminopeptidase [Beggiatoa sp. IS2]|nr:MAG: Xaa-Pro aminopeptidase [Beggiatoa sp. IS2]
MNKNEFFRRRQQLMESMGKGSMVIVPTAPERLRNRDIHYTYRPDSDFYYLTGFPEPSALAVLIPQRPQGQYLLFCREQNPEQETWHGRRAGLEGACELYDADDAFPITDIDDIIPGLMENCHRLYYSIGCYPEFDNKITEWINQLRGLSRTGIGFPSEIIALDAVLHRMRLYKSPAEVEAMRQAALIATQAHQRAMRFCRPGLFEYQIEAEINHELLLQGSRSPSYPTIVASGKNSCILHYTENNSILQEGDLLLIDAGAEYDYYASDITRTFPISGRFSPEQRIVYELVLRAQYAAIDKIRPGNHWNEPYEAAIEVITQGLIQLGLLNGELQELIKQEAYKRFFMHRVGHWLGMDVHDVGVYKLDEKWQILKPGMVMTVEPGIYISASDDIAQSWWNIGIRIEDDVLVTEAGCEVLTASMPKTVEEIEQWMVAKA